MIDRARKALGIAALAGLLAPAILAEPVQADFRREGAAGLSAGLRGGLLFPLSDLTNKSGFQGGLFVRKGLSSKIQLELGAGIGSYVTEDILYVEDTSVTPPTFTRDPSQLKDYTTDLQALLDLRVLYSPLDYEKWNPYLYAGFGLMRWNVADGDLTPRRGGAAGGDTRALGWDPYVPLGLGAQIKLSQRLALELNAHYTLSFTPYLDQVAAETPGTSNGVVVTNAGQGNDDGDAFWGLMAGITVGDFGEKEEAPRPVPMPVPVPVTTEPIPPLAAIPELDEPLIQERQVEIVQLDLPTVHFGFDKFALTDDAKNMLNDAASQLQEYRGVLIDVRGHADDVGTASYNMRLSRKRAQTVKDYLVGQGVQAWRVSVMAFGESQPIASNSTAEGRAQNRRAELQSQQ